jgi:hypothetical protein
MRWWLTAVSRRESVEAPTPSPNSRGPNDQPYDTRRITHLRQYLAEQDAHIQAAELELLYDANAYRCVATVQRVDPPVTVERAWQLAGVLDALVRENGVWIGRVRGHDGRIVWIRGAELRQAGEGPDGRTTWPGDPPAGRPGAG